MENKTLLLFPACALDIDSAGDWQPYSQPKAVQKVEIVDDLVPLLMEDRIFVYSVAGSMMQMLFEFILPDSRRGHHLTME